MNWLKKLFGKSEDVAEENATDELNGNAETSEDGVAASVGTGKTDTETAVTTEEEPENVNKDKPADSKPEVADNGNGKEKPTAGDASNEQSSQASNTDKKSEKSLKVHHLIVLDESGSMMPVRRQTVDGCNETIQTVRKMQDLNADQKHFVSIYLFQTGANRYILKDVPIAEVCELRPHDYRPSACTPLYDAVGFTLTELKEKLGDDVAAYVTIITDGYENDSHHYTLQMVKSLISEMKERNVIFSFIGANIDSKQYAAQMGIDNSMQFTANAEGTTAMWEKQRRAKMRSSSRLHNYMRNLMEYDEDGMYGFGNRENEGNFYDENTDANRITPSYISSLKPNEIFVFGSNIEGRHDGGASKFALTRFGAVYSQAEGPQGQSYAIPTDGASEKEIYASVQRFIKYARKRNDLKFLVTPIGCGAAHYTPYIIAPMFRDAVNMPNVKLPREFWDYL